MTGVLMQAEIAEQPEALARLLSERAGITEVARRIRAANPRFVLFAARGTSDHAAIYATYLVETILGLPCGLASTSVYTAYDQRPDLEGVLWIAISQSGGSPDLVESTERARAGGAFTVAVTNTPGSPLSQASDAVIDIRAGAELSVAATKTYTSSLLALWLLVRSWAEAETSMAGGLVDASYAALDTEVGHVAARYRFADKLVTTSRGYAYPTAREAALKLMETCYLSAHSYSGADLLHGPLAMVGVDSPVITVVPDGPGGRALGPVVEALTARGADLCLVGPDSTTRGAITRIVLPEGLDEQLAPIVQILPLQRLACSMAVARGLDPDQPRGLRKVTQTL